MNIDKSIEILKEFIKNYKEVQEKCKDDEIQAEIERSCYFEEVPAQAIENVLSTLKREKAKIKVLSKINKEIFDEKETWKKIAEKLAEEMVLHGICSGVEESDKCYANEIQCGKCIIDWARKEVENEGNNNLF